MKLFFFKIPINIIFEILFPDRVFRVVHIFFAAPKSIPIQLFMLILTTAY